MTSLPHYGSIDHMSTYTAVAADGFTTTRKSAKVVYTHARIFSFEDGSKSVTFHKAEAAAHTASLPHPSWSNLAKEIVATVVN